MFTLRRPAVFLTLLLTLVVVTVGGMAVLSRNGGGKLLSAGRTNCPPVARNDAAFTAPDQPVTVDVLANDSDVDGDRLDFQVIKVSAGTAEVEFKGTPKLVYTPSSPDGTTAKINYRVKDPSGDVSTAVATVDITTAGALPVGLASADLRDSNGEVLETRCLKVAKNSTTTEATVTTIEANAAPDDVIIDDSLASDTTGNKSAKNPSGDTTTRTTRAPRTPTGGDDSPSSPPPGDEGQPSTPETTRPPTTQPAGPTTTHCDAQCLRDRYDDNPDGPG
jgi:hypothetical protein